MTLFVVHHQAYSGEVYTEPKILEISKAYPGIARYDAYEGWVVISAMIDVNGKPFESKIVDSGGAELFKKTAMNAHKEATFKPATVNGQPIESSFVYKHTYAIQGGTKGAKRSFVYWYKKLRSAIKIGNKDKANKAFTKLNNNKTVNLYEQAYLGLANFIYYSKYGNVEQQLKALNQAIANEKHANYLPQTQFNMALQNLYLLQIKTHSIGTALDTYELLKNNKGNVKFLESIDKTHQAILALKTGDRAFKSDITISDSAPWNTTLLKNSFSLENVTGKINRITIRCSKKFQKFDYQQDVKYDIPTSWGKCNLSLDGDKGTQLSLVQL